MKPLKILLFDIDGTLLLTGGAGRIAIEKAFKDLFGISNCWGGLIPDGKTDPLIFDELSQRLLNRPLTPEEENKISEAYLNYFAEEIHRSPNFRLLPAVSELLGLLNQESHIVLGLQTGNFEGTAWLKLEKAGLKHHFSFGGFGSDSSDRTELVRIAIEKGTTHIAQAIDKNHIYVIGDAPQDIQAGQALEVQTIAVATGKTTGEILKTYKPTHFLESFEDSEKFFEILES